MTNETTLAPTFWFCQESTFLICHYGKKVSVSVPKGQDGREDTKCAFPCFSDWVMDFVSLGTVVGPLI